MQNSARRPPTLWPSPRTSAIGPPVGSYETTYIHQRYNYYSARKLILNVRNNFLAKHWSQIYTLHIYFRHVLLPEKFCWFCCIFLRLTGKRVALKEIRLQPEEGTPFTAIREGQWLNTKFHTYVSCVSYYSVLLTLLGSDCLRSMASVLWWCPCVDSHRWSSCVTTICRSWWRGSPAFMHCEFLSAQLPLIHTICVERPSVQTAEQWH